MAAAIICNFINMKNNLNIELESVGVRDQYPPFLQKKTRWRLPPF